MAKVKALLDTNIVIDFLNKRDPFYQKARLLMIGGRIGEFELWISSSQVTDLVYILTEGGKPSLSAVACKQLQGLRTFVNVFAVGEREIDSMLASSWKNPEDRLLFEVALRIKADCLITRNQADFESDLVRVANCEEFFAWLKNDFGLDYDEVSF
mgnify:CR=1 FL=1